MGLRILLTNYTLGARSGSELYVQDLAMGFLARGHHPVVYARTLGPLAHQLRNATIPVVDDLRQVTAPPDVIHGHHNHELMTALLRFPCVPAVRVCHGWSDAPVQRFWRDAHMGQGHQANQEDSVYQAFGLERMGLPIPSSARL